jgi:hypothetical protein
VWKPYWFASASEALQFAENDQLLAGPNFFAEAALPHRVITKPQPPELRILFKFTGREIASPRQEELMSLI